jgi:predicted dithiol-disulfide oxidoreductase (DUF899 family)
MNMPDVVSQDAWEVARQRLFFHTYSTYDRGTDILNGTLNYLDLTPLGRQEDWEEPRGRSNTSASEWWELHDEY